MQKKRLIHTQEEIRHFIPTLLPLKHNLLKSNFDLTQLYGETCFSLAELNEIVRNCAETESLIKAYVFKEALYSSALDGIHGSLPDIFSHFSSEPRENQATLTILNYCKALDLGMGMISKSTPSVERQNIFTVYKALTDNPRRRKTETTLYRPHTQHGHEMDFAPADKVPEYMSTLEKFINEDHSLPPLIKAAMAQAQFEIIQPFSEGNGRMARLLSILMLLDSGFIFSPLLYPSFYFSKTSLRYCETLKAIQTKKNFQEWVIYYLSIIKKSSQDAYQRTQDIKALEKGLIKLIQTEKFSKMRETALQAVRTLFQTPVLTINDLSRQLGRTYNTAHHFIIQFMELGLISEITDQKRNKLYAFTPYLKLLEKEYA